jgi:hypothetical protein
MVLPKNMLSYANTLSMPTYTHGTSLSICTACVAAGHGSRSVRRRPAHSQGAPVQLHRVLAQIVVKLTTLGSMHFVANACRARTLSCAGSLQGRSSPCGWRAGPRAQERGAAKHAGLAGSTRLCAGMASMRGPNAERQEPPLPTASRKRAWTASSLLHAQGKLPNACKDGVTSFVSRCGTG